MSKRNELTLLLCAPIVLMPLVDANWKEMVACVAATAFLLIIVRKELT